MSFPHQSKVNLNKYLVHTHLCHTSTEICLLIPNGYVPLIYVTSWCPYRALLLFAKSDCLGMPNYSRLQQCNSFYRMALYFYVYYILVHCKKCTTYKQYSHKQFKQIQRASHIYLENLYSHRHHLQCNEGTENLHSIMKNATLIKVSGSLPQSRRTRWNFKVRTQQVNANKSLRFQLQG